MKSENILHDKSKAFAIRIVKLYKYLTTNDNPCMREFFITKLHIAFKEAEETAYWLEILHATEYITDAMFESLNNDCEELIKLLSSIIKSSKQRSPLNS